jgi:membrane protein implicated in regulation of membrane protease activity
LNRLHCALLALTVLFLGTYFGTPAAAASQPQPTVVAVGVAVPGDPPCSLEEWNKLGLDTCIGRLQEVTAARLQCLHAPNPAAPDSGFAGWFATKPTWTASAGAGTQRLYSKYGYAGYDYTTYDIGCADTLMHPDYKLESTIANGEFMIASGIVAASNGLREKAWDPGNLWAWANPLVEGATKAIYQRVFSVFGLVTIAVVGLYLLWRSRQAHMSHALTTAGWAMLVLVAVTALAKWPVHAANVADSALVGSLGVIHDAIGPRVDEPTGPCAGPPGSCDDRRPPAVRAGDTAVETLLYRNWVRGALGSADSETAKKYGPALYRAKSFSWQEIAEMEGKPAVRDERIRIKQAQWTRVAEQIRTEDPEAYEYLRGTKGMERVGAGFVAVLSALAYAMFDIVASLLVLLGFLVIRWAVIAAPALGTVGILRPASAGIRRLVNSVLSALFNILIFGTGAAVYLFAVDLIMSTPALPGWLQVTLVLLCGVVGWLLLRPYTRITQLTGASSGREIITTRPPVVPATAKVDVTVDGKVPEARGELVLTEEPRLVSRSESRVDHDYSEPPRRRERWVAPDVPESEPSYAVYRPAHVPHQPVPQPSGTPGVPTPSRNARTEARTETR